MAILRFLPRLAPALLAITLLAGCEGSTDPIILDRMELVSGDGQFGTTGQMLPEPLVVQVLDPSGNGVRGVRVSWVVETGSGTLSSTQTTTDGSGNAQVRLTLGATSGPVGVLAAVAEPNIVGPQFEVPFNATASAP